MNQIIFSNVSLYMLIIQCIGICGMLMNVISFQQNTNKRIVGIQIFGAIFFFAHFGLLGTITTSAYTGAALNFIGLFRNLVFFCRPKKWANSIVWLYVFNCLYLVAGILTWSSFVTLLPVVAMIFGTVALYIVSPKLTRRFYLICSIGWITYNMICMSIPGVICEALSISSIIAAIVKFDFKIRS